MLPDLNANTSSSDPEMQRWYAEQRNNPAAAPEPALVPQMRTRSPQRLQPEMERDITDDVQSEERSAKRQREEAPSDQEQLNPAKIRRIESEPLVVRLPTVRQQLQQAIVARDLATIKSLLAAAPIDLNSLEADGNLPLAAAATSGFLEAVVLLLKAGADPLCPTEGGQTALMRAASRGHAAVVEVLLKADAGVNQWDQDGWRPLMFACFKGHASIVVALLNKGAQLQDVSDTGQTALMLAAQYGHSAVVNLLLDAGANPNAADDGGWTPLHYGAGSGHAVIVQTFVKLCADLDVVNNQNKSALMLAVQHGHLAVVQLLLDGGVSLGVRDLQLMTPFLLAAQGGKLAIVKALWEKGANYFASNNENHTPLMLSAWQGHSEVVNFLLDLEAEIDALDQTGWTALQFAVQGGHAAIVTTLLNAYADADHMNADGETALLIAVKANNTDIVTLLLERGVTLDLCEEPNDNATLAAIKMGNLLMLELLLSHGGQPNDLSPKFSPLVSDLLHYRGLLNPLQTLEAVVPDMQTALQVFLPYLLPQANDVGAVIRSTLHQAGVCSVLVQQVMSQLGTVEALWQALAGMGSEASNAQKGMIMAGVFIQLDVWIKSWPETFDPYQGLSTVTATRFTALLKKLAAQLSAMGEAHEATTLAAGLDNLLPLCAQYTQHHDQDGFQIDQKGLTRHLTQQLGLYGVLADLVAAAWFNALMEQKATMLTDFNHPSLLPLFGKQLKLLDAVDGRSLLRAPQQQGLNAGTYADLMHRQLHMLSQYWTQA